MAGCSSTPTTVDTGAIRASSFTASSRAASNAHDPGGQWTNANNSMPSFKMPLPRISAGAGLSRPDSGGDVTVAYLVIVGNNARHQIHQHMS